MKNKKPISIIVTAIAALLIPVACFAARDLSSAAEAAVSQVTGLAKILSVLGVVAGALVYQIPGAAMFARSTMIGGFIGAGVSFAAPSVIAVFRAWFGG